ncbi:unnamed protein product [Didymodactylos carnosus]|uniref:Uncharacterized protein n=1 Tax=Didymodactylos carnosus TaxID=1234261 RepID=A0A815LHE8_9BILA|nr:unnamed protein product [Didymodactylos carnosus]CAF1406763.1 unnamed protein product [Didymodactylos carnosus]CAF4075643.1 unnamed protein product [Didymodactylos carnosus]CAF4297702.1 unnamed protein product [Didymodactylos carnosus]
MASPMVSKCNCDKSSECKKGGIAQCDGCKLKFCTIHFVQHRQELTIAYQCVLAERNLLEQYFYSITPEEDGNNDLFKQIDEWKLEMEIELQSTVENAREKVRQAIDGNRVKIRHKYNQLSDELRQRAENDNYYEEDIENYTNQLEKLKTNYSTSTNIHLKFQPIDLISCIQVEDRNQQQASAVTVPVLTDETVSTRKETIVSSPPPTLSLESIPFDNLSILKEVPKSTIDADDIEYFTASDKYILLYSSSSKKINIIEQIAGNKTEVSFKFGPVYSLCYSSAIDRFLILSVNGLFTFDPSTSETNKIDSISSLNIDNRSRSCHCYNDRLFIIYGRQEIERRTITTTDWKLVNKWNLFKNDNYIQSLSVNQSYLAYIIGTGNNSRSTNRRLKLSDHFMNFTLHTFQIHEQSQNVFSFLFDINNRWLMGETKLNEDYQTLTLFDYTKQGQRVDMSIDYRKIIRQACWISETHRLVIEVIDNNKKKQLQIYEYGRR